MHKLFVSGFPLEITELELAQFIAPHGDLSTIKIVRDRKTRICKGYAFVEMQTAEGAANATLALDGLEMADRSLTVKLAEEKTAMPVATRFSNKARTPGLSTTPTPAGSQHKRPRKVW